MFVVMESFPEVVNRPLSRFRSSVQQAHDVGLEVFPDRVEQPTVRVDLFRVLLLETEDELYGDEIVGIVRVRFD
jgi:hypothetical protein